MSTTQPRRRFLRHFSSGLLVAIGLVTLPPSSLAQQGGRRARRRARRHGLIEDNSEPLEAPPAVQPRVANPADYLIARKEAEIRKVEVEIQTLNDQLPALQQRSRGRKAPPGAKAQYDASLKRGIVARQRLTSLQEESAQLRAKAASAHQGSPLTQ